MTYIRQQTLRAYVMAYLFAATQTATPGRTVQQIEASFKRSYGVRRLEMALSGLEQDDLVEDIGPQDIEYALTSDGYDSAERSYLELQNGEKSNFRKLADQILQGMQSNTSDNSVEILKDSDNTDLVPASDRFVEVNHNSAGYNQMVESVEGALEAIRQSNSLDPEDRPWVSNNLGIGLDALRKGGKMLVDGLKAFTVEPLKAALTSVTEEKLKTIISLALNAVRQFLGL